MTELASLLGEALRDPDPLAGIARTKLLIRNRLLKVEPGVEVKETEYFDHSFAPDLLVKPRDGRAGSERWVFLRTTGDPTELAEDLEVVPRTKSVIVSLDRFVPTERRSEPLVELDRVSTAQESLVIDAPTLDRVTDAEVTSTSTALLTRAIVLAGRGALDEAETRRELDSFTAGVLGAMAGESESTRVAVDAVNRRLSRPEANRVNSFLGALWEGGGRSLTDFPGRLGTEGLTAAGLALLLNGPDLPNDPFWQRIASRTSLADIVEAAEGSPDNLQRLVKAGVEVIKAHVCMIDRDQPGLWDDEQSWRWAIDEDCLALKGPGFTAYVAANRDSLPEAEVFRGTADLAQLRSRAREFGIAVRAVRMRTPHRTVGYDSPNGDDIVGDHELDEIGSALGEHSVAYAEAVITTDQRLAVDFIDGIAGMVAPRAQVPIRRLLSTAIQLLESLSEAQAQDLDHLLTPPPPPAPRGLTWEQRSLFDEA